ncbi:UPF0415 protein C7orf25 homolog isoform X1 [Macrobrachium nipponense]|uniref:UPF0415 protein C7orf25 homolog isoform X1 n=1 Tax=Macrobrachium nipponense TaxID=159736 RepID=UPI0030C7A4EF
MAEARAALASRKIGEADVLLEKLGELQGVEGVNKLKKRIKAEINFLKKALRKGSDLKEEHIMCSNLGQLGALYDAVSQASQVVGVLQNFSSQHLEKIVVDVVAENGKQWIKVILRCPKALHLLYVMGGRKGVKPLDEVAEDFLIMAEHHPVFYAVPQVVFWFFSGVSESLASNLEGLGICVRGIRIPDNELGIPDFTVNDSESDCENFSDENEDMTANGSECNEVAEDNVFTSQDSRTTKCTCEPRLHSSCEVLHSEGRCQNEFECNTNVSSSSAGLESSNLCSTVTEKKEIRKLNLDVTAIIAYVSATTNGGANFIFADKVLTEQAMWERQNPVKKTLDQYFQGCELMVCQEAVDHFSDIINTIGGPAEKKRSQEFLARVAVVPGQDIYENQVKIGGKVRKLSRIIFGTGQALKAITVTSNRGFVRSVEQQGIKPVVLYHEPRALTEMKESCATPIQAS